MKDWVNFRQVKEQIAIDQVLKHYGLTLRLMGDELRGQCPLPTHTSRNSDDSFSVNRARNLWCCQSVSCMDARHGQLGGTVLDFVSIMEQCSTREAALRLRDWFGQINGNNRIPKPSMPPAAKPNLPLRFRLQGIDHAHPYLEARGISPSTAHALGIGFYAGPGLLHGRVVIPIHNERNDLLAYAGRAVNGEEPKYRFPSGFHKSQVLFNLNRARQAGERTVIVVEGFFDAAKVHQAGHPAVVGLMGSSLSDEQPTLLQNHFDRAVLMLDGDEAGQRATALISRRLSKEIEVAVVTLERGAQPDQLASGEINLLLNGCV
jgi:5S rRNA maturation endonuclease (ribonuclease M5)